jgi:hypothetical protein
VKESGFGWFGFGKSRAGIVNTARLLFDARPTRLIVEALFIP